MSDQNGVNGGIACSAVADRECGDLALPASGFDVGTAQREGCSIATIENRQRAGLSQALRHRNTQAPRGTSDQ